MSLGGNRRARIHAHRLEIVRHTYEITKPTIELGEQRNRARKRMGEKKGASKLEGNAPNEFHQLLFSLGKYRFCAFEFDSYFIVYSFRR